MQINNVLAGRADLLSSGARNEASELAATKGSQPTIAGTTKVGTAALVAQVMRNYDLTEITPEEFSQMLQKLHDNGSLTDAEYSQLAQLRAEMQNDGISSDESMNLVIYCAQKCETLRKAADALEKDSNQRATAQKSLAAMEECSEWIQKLQLVHQSPESVGLNTTA